MMMMMILHSRHLHAYTVGPYPYSRPLHAVYGLLLPGRLSNNSVFILATQRLHLFHLLLKNSFRNLYAVNPLSRHILKSNYCITH